MRRRAFTLAELLVVLGIIALLMGLLIPTVRGIQAEARSAACMNHMRQIYVGIDSYRRISRELLPMCEFVPVATEEGPQGGLPALLSGYLDHDCQCWLCPADFDEEGSLSTGTSYLYVPGLLRYSPQVQFAVQQSQIPYLMNPTMSQKMKDRLRVEAEARLVTALYESNPGMFAILTDSQDRHRYGDREPKNGLYLDGGVRILEVADEEAQD